MFEKAEAFNGDVSKWDTARVISIYNMFSEAKVFNGDLSEWDTAKVYNLEYMFEQATAFNRDVSKWDTASVTGMEQMFNEAKAFDQNLAAWDTQNVKDIPKSNVCWSNFYCRDFAKDTNCTAPKKDPHNESQTCGATFPACLPGPRPCGGIYVNCDWCQE